ncbi:hypothetical protein L917_11305 [Phytophthora nicotianae]|uniref:Uncharacterized protein n=2 Tax=Phytophthora nicotianae TaxID=4792 RepID=W2KXA5_PHYNI|nr:hypothetical protein L917_11305 [Phytophthora nicotianae]
MARGEEALRRFVMAGAEDTDDSSTSLDQSERERMVAKIGKNVEGTEGRRSDWIAALQRKYSRPRSLVKTATMGPRLEIGFVLTGRAGDRFPNPYVCAMAATFTLLAGAAVDSAYPFQI